VKQRLLGFTVTKVVRFAAGLFASFAMVGACWFQLAQALPPHQLRALPPPPPLMSPPLLTPGLAPALTPGLAPLSLCSNPNPPPCSLLGPYPGPPQHEETEEERDRQRVSRLNSARESIAEADGYLRSGQLDQAIPILKRVMGYLDGETDPEWQRVRTEISKTLIDASVQYGEYLRSRSKFTEAISAYENASSDPRAVEGIAIAYYQLGRDYEAFSSVQLLKSIDANRGSILMANMLLENGAVPLAVPELENIVDQDAAERLNALEKAGLRHFRQELTSGWVIYHAENATGDERQLQYLLKVPGFYTDSPPDATRPLSLSVRPAPREWSWGLMWRSLLSLRWPDTDNAREYSLLSQGGRRVDVVAIWDYLPKQQEVLDYAQLAYDGLPAMQQAEQLLHDGRYSEAIPLMEKLARIDDSWLSARQPHYSALVLLMKAGLAAGDDWGEKARRELIDWHPVWGRLAAAKAWNEENKPDLARATLQEAAEAGQLRYEPIKELTEFEWEQARQSKGPERAAAIVRTQQAIGKLQKIRPSAAFLMQAEVAMELQSYAMAAEALRMIKETNPPDEAVRFRELLVGLNQDDFTLIDQVGGPQGDFSLAVFRSNREPPDNPALIFHVAEIVVLNRDGHHVETFAISSQGMPPGASRQLFLDRINANGLDTLQVFGEKAPDPLLLAKAIAEK